MKTVIENGTSHHFTEFDLSNCNDDFEIAQRDIFIKIVLEVTYKSAKKKRSKPESFF